MQFLRNQLRFLYQNFSIYRGMTSQQSTKISTNNLHSFKSYSCLNIQFHFFEFPQMSGPIIVISLIFFTKKLFCNTQIMMPSYDLITGCKESVYESSC